MPLQYIKVEVSDHIATVVMDRPPVNAQNAQFRNEIMEVFDSFNDRDDVRVAVLTGAGKVFCAGADLGERGSRPSYDPSATADSPLLQRFAEPHRALARGCFSCSAGIACSGTDVR